jgi:PPM family protein phosphatase
MVDHVILAVLVGVGLFIAGKLYRALADEPAPPERNVVGNKKKRRAKGKRRKKRKSRRASAEAGGSQSGSAALPKVRIEEDEHLELTKLTIPSLAVFDDEPSEAGWLPPSSDGHVIPIVYDEDADVDLPTREDDYFLLSAVGQSEKGRRKRNEDRYLVLESPHAYAVADGMGGYAGGDVASKMTVDILNEFLSTSPPSPPSPHLPRRAARLVEAVNRANIDVFEAAQTDSRYAEMGTTLVCARFSPRKKRVYIAHVGDSRCYVYRQGAIHQITKDHTLSNLHGIEGPQGNHLVRAIGVGATVEVDLILGHPLPGDRYLLCSDGLCRGMSDDDIAAVLAKKDEPSKAVRELIEGAIEGGTRDNVTVVVVDIRPTDLGRLNVAS